MSRRMKHFTPLDVVVGVLAFSLFAYVVIALAIGAFA